MSVGDALDNALMESIIGLYKDQADQTPRPWRSLAQVGAECGAGQRILKMSATTPRPTSRSPR
ncbi:hypothetical protein C1I93_01025 [Micromonospora endophytica]|uniref:Uncharacterized protein n=1 Tax=Micromonospora endophytica TaxID=515350 RepID=A0A2W2DAD6_9ACTN|nr:hypothetical protein C1I93_01025 [Micromonospora endophytica]RIW46229.1 hypothetical protein D3H59_13005 [Micromonospora endophytica]